MKKILSTTRFIALAFAAIVVTVCCLTSCTEETEHRVLTNRYTFVFELKTSNPKVAESAEFKEDKAYTDMKMVEKLNDVYIMTETEAGFKWNEVDINMAYKGAVQEVIDKLARKHDDTTMAGSLYMLKDGVVWKSKPWTTMYHGY